MSKLRINIIVVIISFVVTSIALIIIGSFVPISIFSKSSNTEYKFIGDVKDETILNELNEIVNDEDVIRINRQNELNDTTGYYIYYGKNSNKLSTFIKIPSSSKIILIEEKIK